jgi:putative endonuclease
MTKFAKLDYCTYVLFSEADGKLYIGYTTDLKQRLTDHFNGRNKATAPRRPLRLIYCEYHASATDARRRESYFKTTAGKKALNLMLRDSLSQLKEFV